MIMIAKSMSNEPQTLKEFRLRANIKVKLKSKISGLFDKYVDEYKADDLREVLRVEQGFICCYCMSSIETGKTKIEHYKPRDGNEELEIDYKNLYLACDGEKVNCTENQDNNILIYDDCKCKHDENKCKEKDNRTIKKASKKIVKHCDTCKDNRNFKYIDLINIEREIKYKSDGTIYSDNKNIDEELNSILNLSIEVLKKSRKNAKIDLWNSLPKNRTWNIQKIIDKYKEQSKKAPYVGVILYFLNKKLRAI